jgi:hypothetical protein
MKKFCYSVIAASLLAVAGPAFAAKPVSIMFESEGVSPDGKDYAIYSVKCSDGQTQPLTAWDNRKEWCVGKDSKENCERKQIRAAKTACR